MTKEDEIDLGAGIRFMKKRGDAVREGDTICRLYLGKNSKLKGNDAAIQAIAERVRNAYDINASRPLTIRPVIDVLGDK